MQTELKELDNKTNNEDKNPNLQSTLKGNYYYLLLLMPHRPLS